MIKEYGYEYDAVLNEELWDKLKGKNTSETFLGAYCLRSGRDTLKAIAREFEPCTVFLPALACDSMVFPFKQYGHRICFYKLNSDYSIDINSLVFGEEITLFLYMDYFGLPSISDNALENLRDNKNIIFIEDRTHNLICKRESNFKPDYIIASLRKWIAIPDGGLLWGRISKSLEADTLFSSTRLKAQCLRNKYLHCGDENIKTEYRNVFSHVSEIMDNDEPSAMSAYSYALLNEIDLDKICNVRKRNAEILISELSASPHIKLIQKNIGKSDLYVAYTVPNRDEIQHRLSSIRIFNTIIWPLTEAQKSVCSVAKHTEENMLAAPCDQRYSQEDMRFIGKEIVRIVRNVNE